MDELSDDELAGAAAVGDQEAFGILVARMSPILLRYLRRMVDDPAIAEDLAQETLLDAWKSLPDFAFRSTFRTWMFAIAHRRLADHLRRRRDIPTADERFVDLAAPEPMPAEQVITTSLVDALRSELTALPSTSRSVWWLREVEGLALVEISRVLQISVGSVRGHLQRSRKYLSTRLEPWRPGAAPRDYTSQGEASDDHQDTHRRGARA
nr:RNA polymerase sigma factor [Gordonia soli]